MAQPVRQVPIRAPGFQGLNTELSPINGDPEFALVADNVVVDQIGRLASRKAFADYKQVGNEIGINASVDITTSSGMTTWTNGPTSITELTDNVAKMSGTYWKYFELGTNQNSVRIEGLELDAFVGIPEKTTYKLSFSVRIVGKKSPIIPDPETGPPLNHNSSGYLTVTQNNGVLFNQYLLIDSTREDGLEMPDGSPAHQFTYFPEETPSAVGTVDFDPAKLLSISFAPSLWDDCEYEIDVSIDSLEINGVYEGDYSVNEIITLGRDVVGRFSPEQEQSDFRPVFVYRYGDEYVYPKDTRKVPVGMGVKRAVTKRLPELSGSIGYRVGAYNTDTDRVDDLTLPADYEDESLITSTFVNFNAEDLTAGGDRLLMFVKRKPFLRLDNDGQFVPVATNVPIDGDIAISAYGRVWVTGVGGDYHQIWYSTLLDETSWYTTDDPKFNDGGVIDVREYWPVDGDSIVNIHAFNGYLLVFGRNSILVYANADSGSPAGIINQPDSGIFLQDTISNVGLVRRDAICNIGTDVLFVDDSGVRSLGRVIQEKSNPLQEPSVNIRRELQEVIRQEVTSSPSHSAIRFVYLPSESVAVLLFASLKIAYAFHLSSPSKTGGMKVTRWTGCFWNDAIELKQQQEDVVFLAGKPSKGLMKYQGYLEGSPDLNPEPYLMRYESMALALGQSPMQTAIPKSVYMVCMGEYVPGQANALWGFADRFIGSKEFQIEVEGGSEFNVNEFTDDGTEELAGYYPDGGPYYKGYKINTTGSGELFRVGFEVKVQGGRYALQEIDINSAIGRLTA